jgi:hypothetical protein
MNKKRENSGSRGFLGIPSYSFVLFEIIDLVALASPGKGGIGGSTQSFGMNQNCHAATNGDERLDVVQLMPTGPSAACKLSLGLLSDLGMSEEHCDSRQVATLQLL